MTQSTGAQTPEEATAAQEDAEVEAPMAKRAAGDRGASTLPPFPADEKTVTIRDLCARWAMDPEEAGSLQKFMGQDGPWTRAEADELDRRMNSVAEEDQFPGFKERMRSVVGQTTGGPHGPDCGCGDLSGEDLKAVEELMSLLAPALANALANRPHPHGEAHRGQ